MDNQIATYGNVWWNNGRCLGSGRRRTTCSCWLWGSQVTRSTLAYLRNSFSNCVIHSLIHLGLAWQQHADQYFVFIYSPHLWLLKFNPAVVNDSGTYLCHVATDPPLIRYVQLQISGKQFVFPLLPLSLSLSVFHFVYSIRNHMELLQSASIRKIWRGKSEVYYILELRKVESNSKVSVISSPSEGPDMNLSFVTLLDRCCSLSTGRYDPR